MAGTGVEIAIGKEGGGAKYPSSTSTPYPSGGVGGGLSAYDSPSLLLANLLEDHGIKGEGVSGWPSSGLDGRRDASAGGVYGGGAVLITVPGKYRGTKGAGPCIGGPSSEASVWNDSVIDAVSLVSRYVRSRRLASIRRR